MNIDGESPDNLKNDVRGPAANRLAAGFPARPTDKSARAER